MVLTHPTKPTSTASLTALASCGLERTRRTGRQGQREQQECECAGGHFILVNTAVELIKTIAGVLAGTVPDQVITTY